MLTVGLVAGVTNVLGLISSYVAFASGPMGPMRAIVGATVPVPYLVVAITGFGVAGVANALFFASTLAARSEYAPVEARGQVFIWVGALKIAAGSAGTAFADTLIVGISWFPVGIVTILSVVSAAACWLERRAASARSGVR